jgi:ribosomal protein S11
MNRIVKINFTHGPLATGFIHINENNEIVLFTDENGNELTQYESWYIPEEV